MNTKRKISYAPAMEMETQEEADAYLEELVSMHIEETGHSREEALKILRSNLGYVAGYYSAETRERVERLFKCAHPIFGPIAEKGQPSPEEAFEMGRTMGERMRKTHPHIKIQDTFRKNHP